MGVLSDRGETKFLYNNKGYEYMHGEIPISKICLEEASEDEEVLLTRWNANEDMSITCAPKEMGGCDNYTLELRCILPRAWVSNLEAKVNRLLMVCGQTAHNVALCGHAEKGEGLRKSASRESSTDNFLYCPDAKDTMDREVISHFQKHWAAGEPVIVQNVLDKSTGLSWEPLVMWRALSESPDEVMKSKFVEMKAIDCLSGCEVLI